MLFKKISNFEISNRKSNKIWVEKGGESVNFIIDQSNHGQKKNAIEIYVTHDEGKSVVADRFIRILKNSIYKYMTSVLKNVYIDKLDDIVNKQNNTCHSAIKMKPGDVKPSTYADSSKEINNKCLKFKIGDNIRISKYKRIFTKGYVPN